MERLPWLALVEQGPVLLEAWEPVWPVAPQRILIAVRVSGVAVAAQVLPAVPVQRQV